MDLKIRTTDSEEAKGFLFRSSTMVLFEKEPVPIDIATDKEKMAAYLSRKL